MYSEMISGGAVEPAAARMRSDRLWLGMLSALDLAEGADCQLPDGTKGHLRILSLGTHLRITWQPPGWRRASTTQLRVIPKGERTVVAFHQEHLLGPMEREKRRTHYRTVLDELERMIEPGRSAG
jgi:hypothetical protein